MDSILTTKNLTKRYGRDENAVVALDHCSLTIPEGGKIAIVGKAVPVSLRSCIYWGLWTYQRRGGFLSGTVHLHNERSSPIRFFGDKT
ncbi:MAG: hypothetical protein ACLR23_03035 [Clostridia bacterium]